MKKPITHHISLIIFLAILCASASEPVLKSSEGRETQSAEPTEHPLWPTAIPGETGAPGPDESKPSDK